MSLSHNTQNPRSMRNLLREEIPLPAAVVYNSRLQHNLQWMQNFVNQRGVKLAPHGKTTMTPAFFRLQLAAGAWGMTIATPQQARVAAGAGATRVLMANQLVGRGNMQLVSALLVDYPQLELYCLIDSVENARQLGQFFAESRQNLKLLLEIGVPGGRTGCRDAAQVRALCEEIQHWPQLQLAGVETYEGLIHGECAEGRVTEHLQQVRDICLDLLTQEKFTTESVILSGAGSAWYDRVADIFVDHNEPRILPILRPGCYLTHDRGIYQQAQAAVMQRLERLEKTERFDGHYCPPEDLQSGLEIWAYVQSLPEPGMAILNFGKRDAAYDAGLPKPELHFRPGTDPAPRVADEAWQLTGIMDQHAMMKIPDDADIQVGDMLALSTSHPCLTFDKWRQILVIDDYFNVLEVADTCF
ncbi:amino acid deaminase [Microbulbifer bruguierae]|uniref:Amino acid deaminase n=1 Tax=Microbulbifer bruguierae TaxID=3029061 RepID=A0ABY8NB46_9GAMM|nr:amino acid deaminase [Microbulbifer bruguierae]WGL16151.1 amino acid deaminase [Microbulbifer bruguierae]